MSYNQGPGYQGPGYQPPGYQPPGFQPPGYPPPNAMAQRLPSNATAIFIVTALNFLVSPIVAPVGWYLANQELRAIDAGRADPSQRSNVNLCRIVNLVMAVLLVLIIGLLVVFAFFGIVLPIVFALLQS